MVILIGRGEVMELKISDDVTMQQEKMLAAINKIGDLTEELIVAGKELNDAKGKFSEIKAKIKLEKERVAGLKITIRAEASSFMG